MTTATINPLNHIQYSSFYIYGLQKVLGRSALRFDSAPFKSLSINSRKSRGLLFIIHQKGELDKRFFICGSDSYRINEEVYEWCDVYASVNANFGRTPGRKKLVPLAPSFGIRIGNAADTVITGLLNALKYIQECPDKSVKTFLGNYKRLLKRPCYSDMVPGQSSPNYVFFCSTLWFNDDSNQNDSQVNARRASFIRACKQIGSIEFEGGFVAQKGRSSVDIFSDCMIQNSYPYNVWLEKTKRSAVVFNTPAFWDCHGWKLGEYLALGKAIISTPLFNDLPAPLTHGINIHFVENDVDSIKEAVSYIIANPDYRNRLERGARAYWETYGSPEKSLELIGIHKQTR